MFHIYIYTPHKSNGNYLPHIIEHSVFGEVNEDNFFDYELVDAGCSTYYTYFILNTNNRSKLNSFIQQLQLPLLKNTIKYEHSVIREESKNSSYNQKLTNEIGKGLYGKKFKYSGIERMVYGNINDYHSKYYSKNNICILEDNIKYFTEIKLDRFQLDRKIIIKIGQDKDIVYLLKHGIIELFIIGILSDLLDYYIKYTFRFIEKKYNIDSFNTIYGDYDDYIYLSFCPKIKNKINKISKKFIDKYIEFVLSIESYLVDKDFDGDCMVKYGYTLSDRQKKNILNNLGEYYTQLIIQIKNLEN